MSGKTANRISFGSAPVVKRGGSKPATKETAVKGLRDLKACRRLRAVILSLEADIETEAKQTMTSLFVAEGCKTKVRPESFTGVDEGQSANCQLRARSFGPYGVSQDVAAEIDGIGLGYMIEETETFEFNSEVLTPEIQTQIEVALSKIKGLPENLIQRNIKRTLNANAIGTLFATKGNDPQFVQAALPLVSQLAIRVDYNKADLDIGPDVERVAKLMLDPKFAGLVQTATADPDKVLSPRKPGKKDKAA